MLELKNPPPQGHHAGVQFYNFTMRIHGNVFDSSPGAQGYFEMPKACHYERNHSVLAMFNASRGEVEFTILNTHSDKIFCPRVTKQSGQMPDEPVDRCNGGCYSTGLNGKKFTGRFRLGPRRVDDVASTQHHLELVLLFPYKHFGATSWSDFEERIKNTYVPQLSITSPVNSWATKKESQIFRFSLTAAPQIWKGPLDEWFRDRRPRIHSVYPPFGPEEGGSIVTVRRVEVPEPDSGSYHNASITLRHGFLPNELDVMREWGGRCASAVRQGASRKRRSPAACRGFRVCTTTKLSSAVSRAKTLPTRLSLLQSSLPSRGFTPKTYQFHSSMSTRRLSSRRTPMVLTTSV